MCEGHAMSTRANGDRDTPWHPPASLQRHGLRWIFLPLVAFAIFAAGPSALALIAYILNAMVDLSPLVGPVGRSVPPVTLLIRLLVEPLFLTIPLWPFLALYSVARDTLIEQPAEWRSIRLATIGATVAMSLPSTIFLVGAPLEMMSSARDAGQGAGIISFFFMVLLPIPGIIGWFIGRGIAWTLHY
jgi:hypothetical protein